MNYLAYDMENKSVFIPNEEVREEFIRAVKNGSRPELVKAILKSEELLAATQIDTRLNDIRLIRERQKGI